MLSILELKPGPKMTVKTKITILKLDICSKSEELEYCKGLPKDFLEFCVEFVIIKETIVEITNKEGRQQK